MSDQYSVLVVEDEKSISKFVQINLERNGFKVYTAFTGEEGLTMYQKLQPNAIILDIMLPGIDGLEVCTAIRELDSDVIIIMLTAKGQDMDKIMGLELGADDYMVKPFNPLELVARLRANIRKLDKEQEIATAGFTLNISHRKIYKNNNELTLSPREYELLVLFLKHPLKTYSRHDLLDQVWGKDYIGDYKTVDVHIRRLRTKIEEDPSNPIYIETIWGYGYRWRGDAV